MVIKDMAKSRLYRLSPQAENDLDDIWSYTVRQWSAKQAEKYHANIIAAIEALTKGDQRGYDVGDLRTGYFKYPVGRHFIFYRTSDDRLDIIRILHKQMDVAARLRE